MVQILFEFKCCNFGWGVRLGPSPSPWLCYIVIWPRFKPLRAHLKLNPSRMCCNMTMGVCMCFNKALLIYPMVTYLFPYDHCYTVTRVWLCVWFGFKFISNGYVNSWPLFLNVQSHGSYDLALDG
jgi:hypothetical protein